jgi:hypothetical protein
MELPERIVGMDNRTYRMSAVTKSAKFSADINVELHMLQFLYEKLTKARRAAAAEYRAIHKAARQGAAVEEAINAGKVARTQALLASRLLDTQDMCEEWEPLDGCLEMLVTDLAKWLTPAGLELLHDDVWNWQKCPQQERHEADSGHGESPQSPPTDN